MPYQFKIREGIAGRVIGKVEARDADEGRNGQIRYELPIESHFEVDALTGEVSTRMALDYEKQQVHYVVVTAKDNAPDPRIATATMTIAVEDVMDEMPVFSQFSYEVNVPENARGLKIIQVQVSFYNV